jgi:hypothetical protein
MMSCPDKATSVPVTTGVQNARARRCHGTLDAQGCARRAASLKAFTGMERKIEWTAADVLLLMQRFA